MRHSARKSQVSVRSFSPSSPWHETQKDFLTQSQTETARATGVSERATRSWTSEPREYTSIKNIALDYHGSFFSYETNKQANCGEKFFRSIRDVGLLVSSGSLWLRARGCELIKKGSGSIFNRVFGRSAVSLEPSPLAISIIVKCNCFGAT